MLVRATSQKTAITLWALLVWAYRRQMVHYERDRAIALRGAARRPGSLARGFLRPGQASVWAERGCINAAGTTAHTDAHIAHAHVWALGDTYRDILIKTAAASQPPVWNPEVPPLTVRPVLKPGTNQPRLIRDPRSHRPVACEIVIEGYSPEEADAIRAEAREVYLGWWELLAELHHRMRNEDRFERWKISAIGVEREPWATSY